MTNDERDQTPNTMNNTIARPAHARSKIQPVLRSKTAEGGRITMPRLIALTTLTLALITFIAAPLHAQPTTPAPDALPSVSDPSTLRSTATEDGSTINSQPSTPSITAALQPVIDGLAGKYGWLTTVLLAIGSLRILFKPVMLVVENALKNDPAKYAAIQKFEAGPIYKTIATVLDVGASIKLPLLSQSRK